MALEKTKRKNARRCTHDEKPLFTEVLVDDDNTTFTVAIEKLALKCSSNDELFNHAKTVFDIRFQGRKKEQNEQNVENKNRKIISYTKLDVSIPKLHNQLKNIEARGALWCSVKKVFLEISQN